MGLRHIVDAILWVTFTTTLVPPGPVCRPKSFKHSSAVAQPTSLTIEKTYSAETFSPRTRLAQNDKGTWRLGGVMIEVVGG